MMSWSIGEKTHKNQKTFLEKWSKIALARPSWLWLVGWVGYGPQSGRNWRLGDIIRDGNVWILSS